MNFAPLFVAIPLGTAFLISLFAKKKAAIGDSLAVLGSLALLVISINSVFVINKLGLLVYKVGGWIPPIGIALVFDGLTVFMLVTVNLIALLAIIYSINYMEKFTDKWKYYTLFLLMLAGMNGVIITGDLFNLYVFLEIASIASYALVAFGTEQEELEASFKYMILGCLASSFIFLGIAFLYCYTSTLNMADIAQQLMQRSSSGFANISSNIVLLFIAALFLMGFGLKAAFVPFHSWLPDAHPAAPAPVSAMLSGVFIKALGIYALTRIFFNIIGISAQLSSMIMILGILSMVIGVFLAIGQWDFKRLLAYHSISQIGYVALGLGIATPLGILGGLLHLFNHAIFKSLLFLNSGAVVYATQTRDLQKMGCLREKMPVTSNTSLVASMSIAGIPPFNGFFSKLIIIIAAVQAGYLGYAGCAVLASIITLASFLKVQKYGFFSRKQTKECEQAHEVPAAMCFSMIILAILCLVSVGLLLSPAREVFLDPAIKAITNGTKYAEQVFRMVR